MATYTIAQMVQLALNAGFHGNDAATMAAVAKAESGGNPNAIDHDSNGTTDYGLTQINSVHDQDVVNGKTLGTGWAESSLDPQTAFNNALVVFKEAGNSFTPWVTYDQGLYKPYLSAALAALSAIQPPAPPTPTPTPPVQQTYTIGQMVALAQNAGFQGDDAAVMAAVAQASSGGNAGAVQHESNGTADYGLTFINSVHDKDEVNGKVLGTGWAATSLNPQTAFSNAMTVFIEAKNSFSPWAAFRKGLYLQYLPQALAALAPAPAPLPTPTPPPSVSMAALAAFLGDLGGALTTLSKSITT